MKRVYIITNTTEREIDMSIGEVINGYGEKHSPYMGGFINHLPMGQLAVYKMTGDLKKVKDYSEKFISQYRIDSIKTNYSKAVSLEDCLGNRELYEACLDLLKGRVGEKEKDEFIRATLNRYELGMSSGLFHVLIRVAYSVEGYQLDRELISEVRRALAYYITAYKKADVFTRKIKGEDILAEMEKLCKDSNVRNAVIGKMGLGSKMKALYEDRYYLDSGFVVEGSPEEKMKSVLKLAIVAYRSTGSIVALHCITGLHALSVLKNYYGDFSKAVDILTTCIVTHLIADDILEYSYNHEEEVSNTWSELLSKGSESSDVHAVKLSYSAHELYKQYGIEQLKYAAMKRIKSE